MTTTGWARANAGRRPVPFVVLARLLVVIVVGLTGPLAFAGPVETRSVAGAHTAVLVQATGTDGARDTLTTAGAISLHAFHGGIPRGVGSHGEADTHGSGCVHTNGGCPGTCAANAGALPVGWRACVANAAIRASVADRTAGAARARAPEAPFRPPILD